MSDERVVEPRPAWGTSQRVALWKAPSWLVKVTPYLGAGLMVLIISASVLASQPTSELATLGRICHLLSIIFAATLIFRHNFVGGTIFIVLLAATYLLGPSNRGPYECLLMTLMFGAGACIQRFYPDPTRSALIWITIASTCVMFLQVVGVSEWTQILTTHGKISDVEWLSKSPVLTLFKTAEEVNANVLQGRPAGILHSNQFAGLVILFALAVHSMSRHRTPIYIEAFLCAAAVLTLSKVVFVGLAALIFYRAISGGRDGRQQAFRLTALTGGIFLAYAFMFPGLVQAYFLSWPLLWQSIAVRVAQFGVASGISEGSIISYLLDEEINMGLYESGAISKKQLFVIADAAQASTASVASFVAGNLKWFYALIAFIFLVCIANSNARRAAAEIAAQVNYPVLVVLGTFSLSVNFLQVPIFWMMAGFAFPMIWGAAANGGRRICA